MLLCTSWQVSPSVAPPTQRMSSRTHHLAGLNPRPLQAFWLWNSRRNKSRTANLQFCSASSRSGPLRRFGLGHCFHAHYMTDSLLLFIIEHSLLVQVWPRFRVPVRPQRKGGIGQLWHGLPGDLQTNRRGVRLAECLACLLFHKLNCLTSYACHMSRAFHSGCSSCTQNSMLCRCQCTLLLMHYH